jgi:hypothetical protein
LRVCWQPRKGWDSEHHAIHEGVYQVASFHPDYRFADAPDDDPANFTNRSVYPMLHLLREESLEKAIDGHSDPEGLPDKNVAFARDKGLAFMRKLRDACV